MERDGNVNTAAGGTPPGPSRDPADAERQREFSELALPHLHALYNLALSLTRNETEAEDIVQETYLRAYRFFDQFQRGTNCKAWLFRILRNTHINRYRKRTREPQTVDLEDIENQAAAEAADLTQAPLNPRDEMLKDLYDDEIQAALEALPEEFRTAILLSDIEELSYQEIADIMECPLGTVRSRISRGRTLLEKRLHNYAKERGFIRE